MKLTFNLHLTKGDFTLAARAETAGDSVTALVGPSGSGKSTLLRCLAGLEPRATGNLQIGDESWLSDRESIPAHDRRVGYVFQHAALFEHLDVAKNLAFARKRAKGDVRHSLSEIVRVTRIEHLLERPSGVLSGGERQRVAIARAIASNPRLLLLDEPFSALDEKTRGQLSIEFEGLLEELGIPAIFVSHNLSEAARFTRNALQMDSGKIVANGPTQEVIDRGFRSGSSADSPFSIVKLNGRNDLAEEGLSQLDSQIGTLLVPAESLPTELPARLIIRSRDVGLSLHSMEASSFLNQLLCTVDECFDFSRSQLLVTLSCKSGTLNALITRRSAEKLELHSGKEIYALIKSVSFEQS